MTNQATYSKGYHKCSVVVVNNTHWMPHRYGPDSSLLFDYKIAALVCGGSGPHSSKAILKKFLELRKGASCGCG